MSLAGRRVLVTGASEGIGAAVASGLASDGAQIVAVARSAERLQSVVDGLAGDGHRAFAHDVCADWPVLDDITDVVCAAGVLGPIGPVGSYRAADFSAALEINVVGTLNAISAALDAVKQARGAIVTFSGGGATGPLKRYDAYAASKAAVVRLTENLAVELAADGVRVNAIAPGFVATRIHAATLAAGPDQVGADYHARTERDLEQGGVPPELAAQLVAFLLSDQAQAITGKLLSAPWDPWREPAFQQRLAAEPDLATLRRIDDQFFTKLP